ncbi:MAG: glutathione S-transferase family protein [Candidatus Binatia bacterium]
MATILHQFAASPFCDKIRRVLRYKGIPFEIHEWPLMETASIPEKNPAGKLPILEIDGETISDSTDIAVAIEKSHPTPVLIPSDPADRGRVLALEDWADESLYFYEMTTRFGDTDFDRNLPKLVADAQMREMMGEMLKQVLKTTTSAQGTGRRPEAQLATDVDRLFGAIEDMQKATGFVVGKSLTLADIAICAQAECIADSTVGQQTLAKRPAVAAYFKRIDELTHSDRV